MGGKRKQDATEAFLDEAFILCPFYRRQDAAEISCEGLRDTKYFRIGFRTKQARIRFQYKYCCKGFECCPVYRMTDQLYGGSYGQEKEL